MKTIKQMRNEKVYRNDTIFGKDFVSEGDLKTIDGKTVFKVDQEKHGPKMYDVYQHVIVNEPIRTVSAASGKYYYIKDENGEHLVHNITPQGLDVYEDALSDEELGTFNGKPIRRTSDKRNYIVIDQKPVEGLTVNRIQELVWNNNRRNWQTGPGKFEYNGEIYNNAEELRAKKARTEEEAKNSEIERKTQENYQNQKKDLEQATRDFNEYSNSVKNILGTDPFNFAQKQKEASREYAEKRAREDAQRSADQGRQEAIQTARNTGLSAANAALLGGSNTLRNYSQQYNQTLDKQEDSYLDQSKQGIDRIVDQQKFTFDQKRDANSRLEGDRDENRIDRQYYNEKDQQNLKLVKDKAAQILNGAKTTAQLVTGLGGLITQFLGVDWSQYKKEEEETE